jgi:hypothetical protein
MKFKEFGIKLANPRTYVEGLQTKRFYENSYKIMRFLRTNFFGSAMTDILVIVTRFRLKFPQNFG